MASSITKRSTKGSALTSNEVDANFQSLLDNKAELSGAKFLDRPTFNNGTGLTPSTPWDDQNLFGHVGNRNLFIDPNSDCWYSASALTLSAGSVYTSEAMWIAACGTGGAGTSTQGSYTEGWPALYSMPPTARYYNQVAITTASTGTLAAFNGPLYYAKIENVRTLAGRSAVFSVWLHAAAAINITQVFFNQFFGSGSGASTASNVAVPVNWAVSTTPKRFSVRIDLPSVTGKTIAGGNDCLIVGLCLPVGSTYTINIGPRQFEATSPTSSSDTTGAGGSPTPFEYRGIQAETSRWERYWRPNLRLRMVQFTVSGNAELSVPVVFNEMRAAPGVAVNAVNQSGNLTNYALAVLNARTGYLYAIGTNANSQTVLDITVWLDARL